MTHEDSVDVAKTHASCSPMPRLWADSHAARLAGVTVRGWTAQTQKRTSTPSPSCRPGTGAPTSLASWLAWPLDPDRLPQDWDDEDLPCRRFWRSYEGVVGSGSTPQGAYDDLVRRSGTKHG